MGWNMKLKQQWIEQLMPQIIRAQKEGQTPEQIQQYLNEKI